VVEAAALVSLPQTTEVILVALVVAVEIAPLVALEIRLLQHQQAKVIMVEHLHYQVDLAAAAVHLLLVVMVQLILVVLAVQELPQRFQEVQ
jgi:hypothetical protein